MSGAMPPFFADHKTGNINISSERPTGKANSRRATAIVWYDGMVQQNDYFMNRDGPDSGTRDGAAGCSMPTQPAGPLSLDDSSSDPADLSVFNTRRMPKSCLIGSVLIYSYPTLPQQR